MDIVNAILEAIWNILLLVPRVLLELLPAYKALSGFKQDLIAAAFGISPIVIWLADKSIKLLKNVLRYN